jgi:hypothetical protein
MQPLQLEQMRAQVDATKTNAQLAAERRAALGGIFGGGPAAMPGAGAALPTGGVLGQPPQASAGAPQQPGMPGPASMPFQVNQDAVRRYIAAGGSAKDIEGITNLGPMGQVGKVDPKDFTPESIAAFLQTGNPSVLRRLTERKVGPAGQVYDPYAIQPGTVLADPNKPFSVGQGGAVTPNLDYQRYELGKAKAGAANTSIKIDNKTGESLAKEIGTIVAGTRDQALGAIDSVDTANRIDAAISSGRVQAGPTATLRMRADQIAEVLGVAGKDTQERLANTRQVIKGMAELTIAARKSLKGQGQVSDYEGKLLARAASGEIDDLTLPEIKLLTQVTRQIATKQYTQHQRNMETLKSNPNYGELEKFYSVPPLPATQNRRATDAPAQSGGWQVREIK